MAIGEWFCARHPHTMLVFRHHIAHGPVHSDLQICQPHYCPLCWREQMEAILVATYAVAKLNPRPLVRKR